MQHFGCHLSISRGFAAMADTAQTLGADTFQFFTRNPRGGAARAIDPEDAAVLRARQREGVVAPVVAHAPYTVNPCAKEDKTLEFARQTMADDLRRLEQLPGNFYNFHPGSHVGQGIETGLQRVAGTLDAVMFEGQKTVVLLETMAGKGTEVGGRFEELRGIVDRTARPELLGVCLDTCHVHDAGYDIVNDLDGVLAEFDRVIGLGRLRALHLNDSKNPRGAHKDRHERLGQGYIGWEAFRRIVTHPALRGLPMILETPNELPGYAEEIRALREMAKSE